MPTKKEYNSVIQTEKRLDEIVQYTFNLLRSKEQFHLALLIRSRMRYLGFSEEEIDYLNGE